MAELGRLKASCCGRSVRRQRIGATPWRSSSDCTGRVDRSAMCRARDLLRTRLSRRGVVLSAALLCRLLAQNEASAEAIPDSLIDRTLTAAMRRSFQGGCQGPGIAWGPISKSRERISRAEEYAEFAIKDRLRKPRSHTGWFVLIAVLSIGFAIGSGLFNDPFLSQCFKASFASLVRGEIAAACH